MDKQTLKDYAGLIVKVGANVQPGQDVIISIATNQSELATYLVEEAYLAKARKVTVDWINPSKIAVAKSLYESVETLAELPVWEEEKIKYNVEKIPVRIYIKSDDPDALKDMDQKKMAQARMIKYPKLKKYNEALENKYQWTIAAASSPEWAKKVFPDLEENEAVEKLWEAILHTSRASGDYVKKWQDHNADLLKRCNYLNNLDLDYLEYKSSNGTDFKVWMIDQCQWLGGGSTSLQGIYYNPNLPTEECFTSPLKGKAEGRVVASMPLSYQGQLIDGFEFTFKDGKVESFDARVGKELLEQMLNMDENARYLGECALVPYESLVKETGILFYNTLFDENAVCHLALGAGFSECIKDFEKYTQEDYRKMGINDSMIHVDFMIGTKDLSITGYTKDKKVVPIFKNGTWAF